MAKILVTGGAGYIGSHILNLLSKEDHEVIVLDNLSTGRRESVVHGELIVGDIADRALLERLFKEHKFEGVFHFAGSIIVPESVTDPLKYYQNNTENTYGLIEASVKHNVKAFIFSSTAAVYGIPEGGTASEKSSTLPINPYGRTKLMTEWMLEDTTRAHENFNYIALRYFNVAGANIEGRVGQCSPLSTHLIKIACEAALGKREQMSVFGTDYETADGTCIRDYIHIDDLAQAHIDSLNYLLKGGKSQVMNCGYGEGFSVLEVIKTVKKVSGVDFKVLMGARRDGDPGTLKANADKIGQVLGWKPKYNDLELMVKTALDWESKLGQ